MQTQQVIQFIKTAMKKTLSDTLLFTNNPTNGVQTEYLLTVNVAQQIATLNHTDAEPYFISLEQNTIQFARQCLPAIVWGQSDTQDRKLTSIQRLKESSKRTKLLNFKQVNRTHRTGRIDIAIYQKPKSNTGQISLQPLCAIELKSFNPAKNKIIADLERNLFFLKLKGNTGESILSYTVFAALHWNKRINVQDEEQHKVNLNKKYDEILNFLQPSCEHIDISKEVFILSKSMGTVEIEDVNLDTNEFFESLDTTTRHHFCGVIVCFRPTQNTDKL